MATIEKKQEKVIPGNVNRFKLVGNLIGVEDGKAVVETKMVSMATGKTYVDQYPIELSKDLAEKLSDLSGSTVGVIGYVDHPTGSADSHLVALDVKGQSNAMHFNRLQLTGPIYGADIMSRKEGKRQMGNVSFVIASRMINAVTWRGAVTELRDSKVRRDSVITLKGRVRIREYESQGDLHKTVELICDQSGDVEVHYVPPSGGDDEFGFDDAQAVPAAMVSAPAAASGRSASRRGRAAV